MTKLIKLILVFSLIPFWGIAQQIAVRGTVVFFDTGDPIPGVSVIISGTSKGTITNNNGEYELNEVDPNSELAFSFIGLESQIVSIKGRKVIDIQLEEESSVLDEVLVVGYGTQKKRDITGAITSLSAEDMENNPGATITSALQGKIPGMDIITTSGEPGAGVSINIRGASSISGGNEPLYIIDGVPVEAENISSIDGDASFNPIAGLNPNDIESIEVLRDAGSAAIYGSRAANGVVIITTKGAQRTMENIKPRVSFDHTSSLVSVSRILDVLNANEFRTVYREARLNNNMSIDFPWLTNPYHPLYNRTTDWQDEIFRTSYQIRNDLSINGSTNNFSYGISAGHRDLKPVIINTNYQQLNLRGNFSYSISNRISGGTRLSYSDVKYDRVLSTSGSYYSVVRAALLTNPSFTPYDPETGEITDFLGQREQRNPLALAEKVPVNFDRNWITLSQFLDINILDGLDFRTSVSIDKSKYKQSSFTPKSFATISPAIDYGRFEQRDNSSLVNENTLTYKKSFIAHELEVLLGHSFQSNQNEAITLNGQSYVDSEITPIQNASRYSKISNTSSERRLLSYFSRLNYNYKGRYITSLTLRRDGSSRFGEKNRYGLFPAATIGWRFTDESFMNFTKEILDDGKLRGSYGKTGNQFIADFAWQGLYSAASSNYDGNVAILHDALINSELGWETTTQKNIGLDLTFHKNLVSLSIDAYVKDSDDLLFNFPLSYFTGFSQVRRNFGSVENKGMEFLLEARNKPGKKFRWRGSFNISFNKNKITSLPNDEDIIVNEFSLGRVGEPIGVFYAHRALGVFSREEDNVYISPEGEIGKYTKGSATGEVFMGGDMIWEDIDDNGIIDDNDRIIIGSPHPKFIGGMTNNFSYQGFSLNVAFNWSYGNKVMNNLKRTRNRMQLTGNTGTDALDRWREVGDVTDFPMVRYGDPMENFRISSFTMEDGSFLRLKEVTLSYSIPSRKLRDSFISSFRVYISGTNLLTWSKYTGYDPEVNSSLNPFVSGVDNGSFPKSRTYNVGISLRF